MQCKYQMEEHDQHPRVLMLPCTNPIPWGGGGHCGQLAMTVLLDVLPKMFGGLHFV